MYLKKYFEKQLSMVLCTTFSDFIDMVNNKCTEIHPIDTFIFDATILMNYLLITCEAIVETTRVLGNRVGNVFGSGSHDTTLRNGGGGGMVALLSTICLIREPHSQFICFQLTPQNLHLKTHTLG